MSFSDFELGLLGTTSFVIFFAALGRFKALRYHFAGYALFALAANSLSIWQVRRTAVEAII